MLTFAECMRHTGIKLDAELEQFYLEYCENPGEEPVLDREYLKEVACRFEVGEEHLNRMLEALDEIEADPVLHWFTRFLVRDMCAARHRCDLDDYRAMTPVCMKNADLYSFLLLIACVPRSVARLEKLGVPAYFYRDIPYMPMGRQFEKLKKTGDGRVSDFPWDMNFYTCSIFSWTGLISSPTGWMRISGSTAAGRPGKWWLSMGKNSRFAGTARSTVSTVCGMPGHIPRNLSTKAERSSVHRSLPRD